MGDAVGASGASSAAVSCSVSHCSVCARGQPCSDTHSRQEWWPRQNQRMPTARSRSSPGLRAPSATSFPDGLAHAVPVVPLRAVRGLPRPVPGGAAHHGHEVRVAFVVDPDAVHGRGDRPARLVAGPYGLHRPLDDRVVAALVDEQGEDRRLAAGGRPHHGQRDPHFAGDVEQRDVRVAPVHEETCGGGEDRGPGAHRPGPTAGPLGVIGALGRCRHRLSSHLELLRPVILTSTGPGRGRHEGSGHTRVDMSPGRRNKRPTFRCEGVTRRVISQSGRRRGHA